LLELDLIEPSLHVLVTEDLGDRVALVVADAQLAGRAGRDGARSSSAHSWDFPSAGSKALHDSWGEQPKLARASHGLAP
jgi:hypothetical protein